ncbi:MAG TPA: tRNA (adenosine(37)-N6)-dimethylallyltransferase MiaA [Candidatus Paceibacterota bacterium]|jgi:tRNA dimethylallyltransferase|nr:tRNA (adenosine(37)-N6)-dimethylallyltransferase MiaA [Candidatus Paceibacterota bacterium]
MKGKPKIIVILGQTSTGKSDFAVEIAKKIDAEIISADSRQVYKGMNLGTGKITKKEMKGVPHHLLDIMSPNKTFSVSDFQKIANEKIKEIINRGKTPIICGGTGFYIDTIVNGTIFPEVPPNKKLRAILEHKTTEELLNILKNLDEERVKNIDINNRVRIIRAIEIAKVLGKVPSIYRSKASVDFDAFKIGLRLPDETLKERIKTRLLTRIKKGMLKEIQNLHTSGVSWKRMNALGLEYRYGALYLQEKLSKEEFLNKLNTEIWHFAKRQKTWFKRDKSIIWIDPRKASEKSKVISEVKKFLK